MRLSERIACAAIAASISLAPLPSSLMPFCSSTAQASTAFDKDGMETSPLIDELRRRTEANAEQNALAVKSVTQSNAFTAIEGYAPRSYKKTAANCVFERCAPEARPTAKLDEKVDPVQAVTKEFNRVKTGLFDEAEAVASAPEVVAEVNTAMPEAVATTVTTVPTEAGSLE